MVCSIIGKLAAAQDACQQVTYCFLYPCITSRRSINDDCKAAAAICPGKANTTAMRSFKVGLFMSKLHSCTKQARCLDLLRQLFFAQLNNIHKPSQVQAGQVSCWQVALVSTGSASGLWRASWINNLYPTLAACEGLLHIACRGAACFDG